MTVYSTINEDNKFIDKAKVRQKSNELDIIKQIQQSIDEYNKNPNYHYILRLITGVRKAWF